MWTRKILRPTKHNSKVSPDCSTTSHLGHWLMFLVPSIRVRQVLFRVASCKVINWDLRVLVFVGRCVRYHYMTYISHSYIRSLRFYGINLNQNFVLQQIGFDGNTGTPWEKLFKISTGNIIVTVLGFIPGMLRARPIYIIWLIICSSNIIQATMSPSLLSKSLDANGFSSKAFWLRHFSVRLYSAGRQSMTTSCSFLLKSGYIGGEIPYIESCGIYCLFCALAGVQGSFYIIILRPMTIPPVLFQFWSEYVGNPTT